MGVETLYGAGYKAPTSLYPALPVFSEARVRAISSTVTVDAAASIGSKHYFGQVPSGAIIDPSSLIHSSGITSCNDYDLGLELNGVVKDADILADGIDVSGAGTDSAVAAVANANLGKRLWELLGLTSDPNVMYDIVGTMKAAATGAGTLHANIKYKIQ
jgi:hypothetical protein